jgi:hypothetical protein
VEAVGIEDLENGRDISVSLSVQVHPVYLVCRRRAVGTSPTLSPCCGVRRHEAGADEYRVLVVPSAILAVARLFRCYRRRSTPTKGFKKAVTAHPGATSQPWSHVLWPMRVFGHMRRFGRVPHFTSCHSA